MLTSTPNLPNFTYPVLATFPGWAGLMPADIYLCVSTRSGFETLMQFSLVGKMYFLASDGHKYKVSDWTRVKPFGGALGFKFWLEGCIFAVPVIASQTQLTLEEFKTQVRGALHNRFRYDSDKHEALKAIEKMKTAESYSEVFETLSFM